MRVTRGRLGCGAHRPLVLSEDSENNGATVKCDGISPASRRSLESWRICSKFAQILSPDGSFSVSKSAFLLHKPPVLALSGYVLSEKGSVCIRTLPSSACVTSAQRFCYVLDTEGFSKSRSRTAVNAVTGVVEVGAHSGHKGMAVLSQVWAIM